MNGPGKCPTCGAMPGERCIRIKWRGGSTGYVHKARKRLGGGAA